MKLYAGIDLHSNNNFLGISDQEGRRLYKKRLANREDVILAELEPYRNDLVGIVVESTFNWYWRRARGRTNVHGVGPSQLVDTPLYYPE